MKAIVPPLAGLAGLFLLLSTVFAENSGVLLRVEQNNKSDMNPKDKTSKTLTHSLKIYVTNSAPNPAELKAKFTYFGRDMQSHSVVNIASGEVAVTVKPHAEASTEIPPATTTYSERHYEGKPPKPVEASGSRFVGYAVQVFAGTTMVAEAYEPLSVKDEVGKAGAATKAATPAPAKK